MFNSREGQLRQATRHKLEKREGSPDVDFFFFRNVNTAMGVGFVGGREKEEERKRVIV